MLQLTIADKSAHQFELEKANDWALNVYVYDIVILFMLLVKIMLELC